MIFFLVSAFLAAVRGADGEVFADGVGLFYGSDDVGVLGLEIGDGLVKAAGEVWGGGCFELECEAAAAFFEDEVEFDTRGGAVVAGGPAWVLFEDLFEGEAFP
jgi:hypothetical protein